MKSNFLNYCRLAFLCTAIMQSSTLFAVVEESINDRAITKAQKDYADQTDTDLIKSNRLPGDTKSFVIYRGDGKLSLGARAAEEYYFYKNAAMLNDALPDEYGYFKTTADIFLQTHWGKQKYSHKAIEAYFCLRHKSEWGLFGKSTGSTKESVKINQTVLGTHGHSATKPLIWLKDAWLKVSLNAMFNQTWENKHFLKLGFFPFQLGRGIAFGQGYGTSKDFLGIYNRINDFCAPGILLTGSLLKDVLEYDLYYAKYDEKGQSQAQTFASTRENHVGKRTTPFRGVGKDDEAWAMQLRWTPLNDKKYGTIDINPYIFVNEASDRKVEFESDSKSRLGSGGVNVEYIHSRFEIGGECAFNFGFEQLYNIDRNIIKMSNLPNKSSAYDPTTDVMTDGLLKEVYSHVEYSTDGANWYPTPATAAHKKVLIRNEFTDNKQEFTEQATPAIFPGTAKWRNSKERFRPAYRNEYRGWMVVGDASYIIPQINMRLSAGAGAASGDQNPHKDEKNKTYKGFIGLHELYSGSRVSSIFFLDQRTIKRPLTLVDSGKDAFVEDASFTDLWYLGLGGTWNPTIHGHKFCLNMNSMFFFKQFPSKKYDAENNKLSDQMASPYFGHEVNLLTEYVIFTNLKVSAKFAAFIPGSYYNDIRGTPLDGDIFSRLEESDKAQLDSQNYRMNNHTAYFMNFKLEYRF